MSQEFVEQKTKKITNFALNPEKGVLEQFESCWKQDFVISASLMPDAHTGYVAPIGSVLITKEMVVPAWVGYDIGCGMIAIKLSGKKLYKNIEKNKERIFQEVIKKVPMGFSAYNHINNISNWGRSEFNRILKEYQNGTHSKDLFKEYKNNGLKQVGSLGSGNHFIELGITDKEEVFLVIHSGSRNLGHKTAEYYMKKASGQEKGFEKTHALDINSTLGKEYLNALNFCLEFALINRLEMGRKIHEVFEEVLGEKIEFELMTNKTHNHALVYESQEVVHRKGATSSKLDEIGVIPGNMKDGSFIVKGKGNNEFLDSSSHGAGRVLSRNKAKEKITLNEFKNLMKGITANISEETIDESPNAYKSIFEVMDAQKASVDVLYHIKPIINWKGV